MMINDKTDLLDPLSKSDLSDYEKEVVEDAQNTGKNLESSDPDGGGEDLTADRNTGGIIKQTIDSKAVEGFGTPGGDSDISGRIANSDETNEKKSNRS